MIPQIIFDSRHPDGLDPLLEVLKNQNILHYNIWTAVALATNVVASINASHKAIVKWAKENNLPEVCIFEQDIIFTAPDAWQFFLKNKPKNFDLYFGGLYTQSSQNFVDKSTSKPIGFHCYVVSQVFYDVFLSTPDDEHIDKSLWGKGDYKLCYPMPALQRPGYSFNEQAFVDKNKALLPKDIYQ